MPGPDVVVVGDVMMDVSVAAPELERGGDVHGRVSLRPGGGGANAAVWAAHAGATVTFHGRVGDDAPGRVLVEALRERGVGVEVSVDPEAPTGAILVVHQGNRRSMVADRGANARIRPEDLPDRLTARAVHLSGYLLFHPGSEPAARAALDRADASHVAVDAASWPLIRDYGPERFVEATGQATLLLANEDEARTLAAGDPEDSARALSASYRHVVVKLADGGTILGSDGGIERIDARRVEPVDPTGAGDAFAGVLLARLARGTDLSTAATEGARAAGTVVGSAERWPERG
ncbi:MAG TPA: PfkB family carbohydrate kinase [Actinomycetota bacterium]|nr:PfkB family carbohydrate kinase [Actinomycetota bacterium]